MKTAHINVTVATLWTGPDSPRDLDQEAIEYPVQIEKWLNGMSPEERKQLLDDNKIQSQVLYGETVYVLEEKDGWSHVLVPSQASKKNEAGYPGWIPSVQLTDVSEEDAEREPDQLLAMVTAEFADLKNENGEQLLPLVYTTILPVLDEGERIEVHTPHGSGFLKPDDVELYRGQKEQRSGLGLATEGERFIDLLYLWGGMTPYGYDCSGFSYSIHKANGYIIPRDASDQAAAGVKVKKEDVQPGDLLFFAYEEGKGRLHHVGIYHGDGKMIHSPTPGKRIMIQEIKGSFYEKEWCETRRYWKK
ncbi:C40 family peptidase [Jeotgalibacillus aurantiacus]|uniref:C40 family peptidase n=1 Tax=Jeotgalibacillus aurantiacus TaxID=2763266 RepID=UPI001D0B1419|nr:C40 family peptidase [Jeotgalibacillus aurantiacus]